MIYKTAKVVGPNHEQVIRIMDGLRLKMIFELGILMPKVRIGDIQKLVPIIQGSREGGILFVNGDSITKEYFKNHAYFVGLYWEPGINGAFNVSICTGRNNRYNIIKIANSKQFVVCIIPE